MKKSLSFILSLILIISSVLCINISAYANECEHKYEPSFDYNESSETLVITPKCSLCEEKDDANAVTLSNFSFENMVLSFEIDKPESEYIKALGISGNINGNKATFTTSDALEFVYRLSDKMSDEDKAQLAQKLGVDVSVISCRHQNLFNLNNLKIEMTDMGEGKGYASVKCPDCALEMKLNFTITEIDPNNMTATITFDDYNQSIKVDLSQLVAMIPGLDGAAQQGGSNINYNDIMKLIEAYSGSGGSSGSGGYGNMSGYPDMSGYANMAGYGNMGNVSNVASKLKPKSTSIKKLSKQKKAFKVTWKKISNVTGYQIQYCTSSKFKKKVKGKKHTLKSVNVNKAKATSKTVKKLKSKKTYYVRVRTFITINNKKYYSKWSKVKKVKTK